MESSKIFFPLRTNANYFKSKQEYLDLKSRVKQSLILFDELLFQAGEYHCIVGPKGIIQGFKVITFPENLGYDIQAIITFQIEPSYENYIQMDFLPNQAEENNSRLLSLYRANDKNTFMLEVLSKTLQDLNFFIKELKQLKGVSKISRLLKQERIYEYIS